ncbi:AlpA family phage regulatory protein [Novosphingobium sp.]|uniref:helix-turn-helix transcriptional regulator n=1 Tax=Novosphingobium sp. TaxID=1874826 RepID=UPI0031D7F715
MANESDRYLRLDEVLMRTSLSRATLYRKIQEGSFPAQAKLSHRRCGWKESVIRNWCDNPMFWSADNL